MTEQLPIVAWKDSWGGYGKWGKTVALTPHAPAQSALDELRAENAALKEKLQEQALQALSDDGQWMKRTDDLRREVEALRADRDRLAGAIDDYLEAQDALDDRELMGPNAESYEVLIRRRNRERNAIDTDRASTDEGVGK